MLSLLLPHIKIHNANALSSPYTIGFPAMSAFMGASHALQRYLQEFNINFKGVAVISHNFNLQTYKGLNDFEHSIIGVGQPLELKAEGKATRASFIEAARCHLEISLVISCSEINKEQESLIIEKVSKLLNSQIKIAGGDILSFKPPKFYRNFEKLRLALMPGYALLERRDLVKKAMEAGQDALDAIIDNLALHHECERIEDKINWHSRRKNTQGWIIPIATGFQGISELGHAKNQRDQDTLHCFAEAIVTLGEFKMIYKFDFLEQLLWHYIYDAKTQGYYCQQQLADRDTLLEEDGF